MNLSEACELLGINENSSLEEAKKSFRKSAAKYHPDNKATGDEDKFKKLNEAQQVFEAYKNGNLNNNFNSQHGPFYGDDPFAGFGGFPFNMHDVFQSTFENRTRHDNIQNVQEIILDLHLTFNESILGAKKDVSFEKRCKCEACNGLGHVIKNNGCQQCGGSGVLIARQGHVSIQRPCNVCNGRISRMSCANCSGAGGIFKRINTSVKVPGGVKNGVKLKIEAGGHYAGSRGHMDMYSNVLLNINVENHKSLSLEDDNVISKINICLLEALSGCQKDIETIDGMKKIDIPGKTKNNDVITIPGLGVERRGSQKIYVDVSYPQNIDDLIQFLSSTK